MVTQRHGDMATLASELLERCRAAGFVQAGIATLEPLEHPEHLREWIATDKHGEMGWLAKTSELRTDPSALLEGARAAVMVADEYAPPGSQALDAHGAVGLVARYAWADDYHKRIRRRLRGVCDELRVRFPDAHTRIFTDTAPVAERELAQRAGLGWTGKHTLAINAQRGSWFVLGGFLTTLELRAPREQPVATDHCGSCTRCIDSCPTDAITPYSVDASRCVSYLTLEHRGPIAAEFLEGIGPRLAGCDVCQDVCPHNRPRREVSLADPPAESTVRTGFDLLDVLGWDEATRRARFAGSALKRLSLAQAQRNAAINAQHALRSGTLSHEQRGELRTALEALAWNASADPIARDAASEALRATACMPMVIKAPSSPQPSPPRGEGA